MDVFIAYNQPLKKVILPPSKSVAQRAILAASLCHEPVILSGLGQSKDVKHFLEMSKQLGAVHQEITADSLEIQGFKNAIHPQLHAGESGLGLRLITGIAAILGPAFHINGEGSLLNRPILEFESILPQLGVHCQTNGGFLPLQLSGTAKGGKISIDGRSGSQYLSGLLMALPLLKEDSIITVDELTSKPYIDLTLSVLDEFGIEITHDSYRKFTIKGGQHYSRKTPFEIELDYSGASILMVEGAIHQGIRIENLNPNSIQGDKAMLAALTLAGVQHSWEEKTLQIKASEIKPFEFDATQCPDLFPSLVVLAAAAKGESTLIGANRLINKESNRATVLVKEFGKLGLKIDLDGEEMKIFGTGKLSSGTVFSHNDHRIAMAGAVAAKLTDFGITIEGAESVEKSYPEFWNLFF